MTAGALRWVATCSRGLEEILAAELAALGLPEQGRETGGVSFDGPLEAGLRANWRLRTANRVLIEVASWPAADDEELYRGARALLESHPESGAASASGGFDATPARLFVPARSFAIQATSNRSRLRDTRWIALKVKDALVDAQRDRFGRRAMIDRADPDLRVRVRLFRDRATMLLDTSGEPLDRRGYRVASTAAPVREQIAAAALLAAGWTGCGPVVDPMCGSGTFLAEAGALALGLAPNRLRSTWAFERLPGFDAACFARVRDEAIPAPDLDVRLVGVDRDPSAVAASRANLAAAGLSAHATLTAGDAFSHEPGSAAGLVTINPPYGERLEDSPALWRRIGDLLKQRYRGWLAVLLAGDERLGKDLGLRPRRRIPFWNGKLEARILVVDLY